MKGAHNNVCSRPKAWVLIPVLYKHCAYSCVIPDLIRDLKVLQACEIPAPGSESGAGRDDILALHNHFSELV